MFRFIIFFSFFSIVFSDLAAQTTAKRFPQHVNYTTNHIKPSNYTQNQLDDYVKNFYSQWKSKYVKSGCGAGRYYIDFNSGNTLTVSEAMGYGMMILPLMAGHDSNAKVIFDGLFKFCKDYPSEINPDLMAWKVIDGCRDDGATTAASDGDIDIAYGLLLADIQWGSHHEINYYVEAKKIIDAILKDIINTGSNTVKLGDWASSANHNTRPSDFILDHFRVFKCVSGGSTWDAVVDKCYSLLADMQTNYSSSTGLIPDFIVNADITPKPASANFLEGDYDGHYYYNSCRVPWRITTDYLLNGDERGKNIVNKINSWLRTSTLNNPDNITSGYLLDGTAFTSYDDNAFVAPFMVGAMLDTENQQWLDLIFEKVVQSSINDDDYYSNTIKLLSLLVVSGNYWAPDCNVLNVSEITKTKDQIFRVSCMNNHLLIELNAEYQNQNFEASLFHIDGSQSKLFVVNKSSYNLNISDLPKGCYILQLKNKRTQKHQSQKIVF